MKRGMTLIELLAALSILTAVSVAASSWTVAAARTSASVSRQLNWERAANAALDAIIGDLIAGDFSTDDIGVETNDDRLIIRTRDSGPVEHEYLVDDGRLMRLSFKTDGTGERTGSSVHTTRVLVGGVTSWSVAIDEDEENEKRTLALTLVGPNGLQLTRSDTLP